MKLTVAALVVDSTAALGQERAARLLPREDLAAERRRLVAERPGLGLPIGLLVGGLAGLGVGAALTLAGMTLTTVRVLADTGQQTQGPSDHCFVALDLPCAPHSSLIPAKHG